MGIGYYEINDLILNMPFAQDIGWPNESPSVVGQLVPLGWEPNQTLFIYVGTIEPTLISLPKDNEGVFCNSLEYLSPFVRSFFQIYFYKCQ